MLPVRSYYQRVEPDTPYLRQRFVIYSEVTMGLTGDAYDASKVQVSAYPSRGARASQLAPCE